MNEAITKRNEHCCKNGKCADCLSEQSICIQFVETRLSNPAGRIKVILVGEELGF